MIAIIDYDAGNIKSVEKALHYLGEETIVTRDCREEDPVSGNLPWTSAPF